MRAHATTTTTTTTTTTKKKKKKTLSHYYAPTINLKYLFYTQKKKTLSIQSNEPAFHSRISIQAKSWNTYFTSIEENLKQFHST